jgi:hypothetical protein
MTWTRFSARTVPTALNRPLAPAWRGAEGGVQPGQVNRTPVAVRNLADDCLQHFERYQNLTPDVLFQAATGWGSTFTPGPQRRAQAAR